MIERKRLTGIPPSLILDFETRSRTDLKTLGVYRYIEDKSTSPICMGFMFPFDTTAKVWKNGEPFPGDVVEWINRGGNLIAWNSNFDRLIFNHVLRREYKSIPYAKIDSWLCAMIISMQAGYAGSLEEAAYELGLPVNKDERGKKLIAQLSHPNSAGEFNTDDRLLGAMYEYCRRDVEVTKEALERLPYITKTERTLFCIDQRINDRGVKIDTAFAYAAHHRTLREKRQIAKEFESFTGFRPTQRKKFLEWLQENGIRTDSTNKKELDSIKKDINDAIKKRGIKSDEMIPPKVARVLKAIDLVSKAGQTSLSKYKAALQFTNADHVFRGGFQFFGATTGRWSGRGIQLQNVPRKSLSSIEEYNKYRDRIMNGEDFEDPLDILVKMIRGMMIPRSSDTDLFITDFAQIEARVLMLLSEDITGVKTFKNNQDIYCDLASDIYGRTITKADKEERFVGKSGVLGLGYGMGAKGFLKYLDANNIVFDAYGVLRNIEDEWKYSDYGKEEAAAKYIVDTYRRKYEDVPEYWERLNRSVVRAIKSRAGKAGEFQYNHETSILSYKLPSGRRHSWYGVKLDDDQPTYIHREYGKKKRRRLWHGVLSENIVSGTSRDIMAAALVALEYSKQFTPIGTIHDEIICEGPKDETVENFESIVYNVMPPWTRRLMRIETNKFDRYFKEV